MVKLLEIANALEADHAGRISVGAINRAFLDAGGNVTEYGAAMHRAVRPHVRSDIAPRPKSADFCNKICQ